MARIFELTTPLGKDPQGQEMLRFRAWRGSEELGRLSEFELSAVSSNPNIPLTSLLAKKVTVRVELSGGGFRFFNGHVTRFAQDGMVGRLFHYRATVRPWLWFLTRTADCRIFQEQTVPQILADVFADHPDALFENELTGKFATREYCVQYRETDFNFVSRIMEEEGIHYFFDHHEDRHVMKLVDSNFTHKPLAPRSTLAFFPPGKQARLGEEFIHAWDVALTPQPGVVALDDYDFKNPKADLGVRAQLVQGHERADSEVFDWPGEYLETETGEHLVRARIQELHSDFDRAEAECNVREMAVGRLFTLTTGPRPDQEREYLITRASYELRDNAFESSAEGPASYHCQFSVLQSQQQFSPARLTPEPKMTGPQTAVVVGTPEDEIVCDAFGRVKVLFHWDRIGKKKRKEKENADSSCFLRVTQPWAGSNWGVIFLPRRGQEVLVDFLEGDPDQPIIVGSLYNKDQMPPYDLPANKTQSGIKTRSAMNGTPTNFNEIRFEDKKGQEQLVIHAERTMLESVEGSQSVSVGGSQSITVGSNRSIKTGNEKDGVKRGDVKELVHNNHNLHVKGDSRVGVDGASTVNVTGNRIEAYGAEFSLQAANGVLVKAATITLHGTTSITLIAGGSSIVIDAGGVTVLGAPMIKLNPLGAVPPVPPTPPIAVLPDDP
ncbi:MAG TPA: type VI secretion system tip protein TssI/VgrG [Candidatus Binatia bacterium]|nr:type VI secretion system tip protein TssI/VgrG [Candidatus Binatia bacterium]